MGQANYIPGDVQRDQYVAVIVISRGCTNVAKLGLWSRN